MPKLLCTCGKTLNYGEIPCDDEFLFISDNEFDKYSGMVDSENIFMNMKSFLKCPECNRLFFFWNGFNEKPEEFLPATRCHSPRAPEKIGKF